jgi:MFS superfamily sulfate permease-like transporter
MIGQTMINVNSGGRGRLSGLVCAGAIALFVVAVSSQIENIPLAALVGVMCKVVFDTFGEYYPSQRTQSPCPKLHFTFSYIYV